MEAKVEKTKIVVRYIVLFVWGSLFCFTAYIINLDLTSKHKINAIVTFLMLTILTKMVWTGKDKLATLTLLIFGSLPIIFNIFLTLNVLVNIYSFIFFIYLLAHLFINFEWRIQKR